MRTLFITILAVPLLALGMLVIPRSAGAQDRMPMSSAVEQCVIAAIGQDRFTAISTGQAKPTDAEEALVKSCFTDQTTMPGQGDQPSGGSEGEDHHAQMDPTVAACLQTAVGADRFTAISSGQAKPTDAEEAAGQKCFGDHGEKAPTVNVNEKITGGVEQCLKLALGEDRFNVIHDGKSVPTLAERDAAQKCFGAPSGPMSPDVHMDMGPKLMACLKAAVGETRFQLIGSGSVQPTAADMAAGQACFTKFKPSDSSEAVLPPATQEVPFLPVQDGIVNITKDQVVTHQGKTSLVLQGKGKPNAVVDIHLFSKGTTVSVQTDKNGNWKYTFNRSLAKGTHRLYVTARNGKKTVRSKPTTVVFKTATK